MTVALALNADKTYVYAQLALTANTYTTSRNTDVDPATYKK